jgi:hypothetical protein
MAKYVLTKIWIIVFSTVVIISFGAGLSHPEGEIDLLWPQIILFTLCPIAAIDVWLTAKVKSQEKEKLLTTQWELKETKMELDQKELALELREKEIVILELKKKRELITEDDIRITKERRFCLVHRGNIEGYSYICPNCGALYCQNCFVAIKDLDNLCWSCGDITDPSMPTVQPLESKEEITHSKENKA